MKEFSFDIAKGIILCKAKLINKKQSAFIKLAVDTRASLTMISSETAIAIGIDFSLSQQHLEITTASGTIFAPVVTIPAFRCFGTEIKNLKVVCHSLPPETTVEGLLGLDFLEKAKITIDFSRHIVIRP